MPPDRDYIACSRRWRSNDSQQVFLTRRQQRNAGSESLDSDAFQSDRKVFCLNPANTWQRCLSVFRTKNCTLKSRDRCNESSSKVSDERMLEDDKRKNYGGVYVGLPTDLSRIPQEQIGTLRERGGSTASFPLPVTLWSFDCLCGHPVSLCGPLPVFSVIVHLFPKSFSLGSINLSALSW
ncbi:hypothetical protein Q8A73_021771 [Channa argus]|nr:hypothetical protein Q8A73_021771 [Channa argus]